MSITSGFGERVSFGLERGFYVADVLELLEHTINLEAMLRKHQWANYDSEWGDCRCPECGGSRYSVGHPAEKIGHSPDCALAKLIGE